MDFSINTKTTGFGSPARAYVDKRLNPNDLLIKDIYTTFFFQWEGDSNHDLVFCELPKLQNKTWMTRRDFLSPKFTTDWNDIPKLS